jgi:hypothetical protein
MSIFETLDTIVSSYEIESDQIFDHVLFLNPQYIQISPNLLSELISKHFREFQDLTFFGQETSKNIWQIDGLNLMPLTNDALINSERSPTYIAYYGLGTIVSRPILRSFNRIPEFIGIIDLPADTNVERVRF